MIAASREYRQTLRDSFSVALTSEDHAEFPRPPPAIGQEIANIILEQTVRQSHGRPVRKLDLLWRAVQNGQGDVTSIMTVLEETLEGLPLTEVEKVWDWVERCGQDLFGPPPRPMKTTMALMRLGNMLLKRCPKATHAQLAGRVLCFMSLAFPPSERAGVNLRGEFNTANTTILDPKIIQKTKLQDSGNSVKAAKSNIVEDDDGDVIFVSAGDKRVIVIDDDSSDENKGEGSSKTKDLKGPVSDDFYLSFWGLQASFSDPMSILQSTDNVQRFKSAWDLASARIIADPARFTSSKSHSTFYPKYLTGRVLLDTQLADGSFRRQFLMQSLVLLQFLLLYSSHTKASEFWSGATNHQMMANLSFSSLSISPENETWFRDAQIKCRRALSTAPRVGDGVEPVRTFKLIQTRESNWANWKARNCPAYENVPSEDIAKSSEGRKNPVKLASSKWPYNRGTKPLTDVYRNGYRNRSAGLEGLVKDLSGRVVSQSESLKQVKSQWESAVLKLENMKDGEMTDADDLAAAEQAVASAHWRLVRVGGEEEKVHDGSEVNEPHAEDADGMDTAEGGPQETEVGQVDEEMQ